MRHPQMRTSNRETGKRKFIASPFPEWRTEIDVDQYIIDSIFGKSIKQLEFGVFLEMTRRGKEGHDVAE